MPAVPACLFKNLVTVCISLLAFALFISTIVLAVDNKQLRDFKRQAESKSAASATAPPTTTPTTSTTTPATSKTEPQNITHTQTTTTTTVKTPGKIDSQNVSTNASVHPMDCPAPSAVPDILKSVCAISEATCLTKVAQKLTNITFPSPLEIPADKLIHEEKFDNLNIAETFSKIVTINDYLLTDIRIVNKNVFITSVISAKGSVDISVPYYTDAAKTNMQKANMTYSIDTNFAVTTSSDYKTTQETEKKMEINGVKNYSYIGMNEIYFDFPQLTNKLSTDSETKQKLEGQYDNLQGLILKYFHETLIHVYIKNLENVISKKILIKA